MFWLIPITVRWECTNGVMCRKSREEMVTPEVVRDHWDMITDFSHSYNPESGEEATAHLVGVSSDEFDVIWLKIKVLFECHMMYKKHLI